MSKASTPPADPQWEKDRKQFLLDDKAVLLGVVQSLYSHLQANNSSEGYRGVQGAFLSLSVGQSRGTTAREAESADSEMLRSLGKSLTAYAKHQRQEGFKGTMHHDPVKSAGLKEASILYMGRAMDNIQVGVRSQQLQDMRAERLQAGHPTPRDTAIAVPEASLITAFKARADLQGNFLQSAVEICINKLPSIPPSEVVQEFIDSGVRGVGRMLGRLNMEPVSAAVTPAAKPPALAHIRLPILRPVTAVVRAHSLRH